MNKEIKYIKDYKTGNRFYPIVRSKGIVDAFNINEPLIDMLFNEVLSYAIADASESVSLLPGESAKFTLRLNTTGPIDESDITWASSDTDVATVDLTGYVETVGEGTTNITADSDLYEVHVNILVKVKKVLMWSITYKSPVEIPHILESVPENIRKACKYHYDLCNTYFLGSSYYTEYLGSDYNSDTKEGNWYFSRPILSTSMFALDIPYSKNGTASYCISYTPSTCSWGKLDSNGDVVESGECTIDITPITGIIINEGLVSCPAVDMSVFSDLEELYIPKSLTEFNAYSDFDIGSSNIYSAHPKAALKTDYIYTISSNVSSMTIPDGRLTEFGPAYDLRHFKYLNVESNNNTFDSRNNCNAVINTETNTLVMGSTNTFIPDSVTAIGPLAFNGVHIDTISIPNTITSLGARSFYKSSIKNVELPDTLTTIPVGTFEDCSSLTQVNIPSSVSAIGMDAFKGCTSLLEIVLPNSITQISDNTFMGCTSLLNVTLPNCLTSINAGTFSRCTSLKSIVIPATVNGISYTAFEYCPNIEFLSVDAGNTVYDSRDNCNAIIHTATNTIVLGSANTIIPSTVTKIQSNAFLYNTLITSIVISENITLIGSNAFSGCSSLTAILWNAVKGAFEQPNYPDNSPFNSISKAITSFTFGDKVQVIPKYLCRNMNRLTTIDIPSSVTKIEDYAFLNCESLQTMSYQGTVEQWQDVLKGPYYLLGTTITTIICSNGTITL